MYVRKADDTYLGILRIYSATTTSDGPGVYVHKADEMYLGILRINSATTTSHGPGVYIHKANETYLGILRIYSATTTSNGPWTYVLRGCKCLASLEYLLGPVLLAFAYAGLFLKSAPWDTALLLCRLY